jgi:DNA-binding Xre family transcriptional regulator
VVKNLEAYRTAIWNCGHEKAAVALTAFDIAVNKLLSESVEVTDEALRNICEALETQLGVEFVVKIPK